MYVTDFKINTKTFKNKVQDKYFNFGYFDFTYSKV